MQLIILFKYMISTSWVQCTCVCFAQYLQWYSVTVGGDFWKYGFELNAILNTHHILPGILPLNL